MATTVFFLSGTTAAIPSDYPSGANNQWHGIGAGGGGAFGASGASGGGGEYRRTDNVTATPGGTLPCAIGTGGTGATTNVNGGTGTNTTLNTNTLIAVGGGGGTSVGVGGAGGTGGTGAAANNNGGAGATAAQDGGAGGGGAGGPLGVGAHGGGAGALTPVDGGSGGGGSNGGSVGVDSTTTTGGAGGNGQGGSGGGAGGGPGSTGVSGTAGTAGTGGGGGGGGVGTVNNGGPGGNGGTGNSWTQTSNSAVAGPGGGGGGGGSSQQSTTGAVGGTGGLYGGGGGGGGGTGASDSAGGNGAAGILVLIYTPTTTIPAWNFEQIDRIFKPQRVKAYHAAALMGGDDRNQNIFTNWKNTGWEFQASHLLPKFHPAAKTAPNFGDDGTQATFVNWKNSGWEIQSVQPPHFKTEIKGTTLIDGDKGIESPYVNWKNAGWEPNLPIVPSYVTLPGRNWAAAWSQMEDGIEGPFVQWRNLGWEIQPPQPPHKFYRNLDDGDTGTETQFINWLNSGWEIQAFQPSHLFVEKRGSVVPKEDGNEGIFVGIQQFFLGFEQIKADLRHIRYNNPDFNNGTGIDSPFIRFFPYGWEVPPYQPQHLGVEKHFASMVPKDDGTQSTFINWFNFGWDVQSVQPPHFRPEKAASVLFGDIGTQAPFIFVPVGQLPEWGHDQVQADLRAIILRKDAAIDGKSEFASFDNLPFSWEIQAWQLPHRRYSNLDNGDTGAEEPFVFVSSTPIVWGFEFQQLVLRRLLLKDAAIDGRSEFASFDNLPFSWEIQAWQPPHFRPEKSGSILFGDTGAEGVFSSQVTPVPLTAWQFDIQPTLARFPLSRYAAIEGISDFAFFDMQSFGWENQAWQPPHQFVEKRGLFLKIDDVQAAFIRFLPYGWEIQPYQPQHLGVEKRGALVADGDRGTQFRIQFPVPLTNWAFDNFLMVPSARQFLQKHYAGAIFGAVDAGSWPPGFIAVPSNFDYIIRARRRARR